MARRKKRKWSKAMKITVIIESVILAVLLAGAVVIASTMNKIERIEVEQEAVDLSITEEVEHKTGYMNVAIFGLDTRKGDLGKGNLSDTILVASLNHETNEVKMVSVYRDTLMQIGDSGYNKANAAYSFYGPEGAITMLNKNLDLNIDKYVTVNFNAMVDVVDAVGGIDLDLTYEEVVHMNNYCVETSKVTGKSYEKIEPAAAGTYHLNGVQAVSYTRIRYTAGGDAKRTERQRLVIGKILEKVQDLDLAAVNDIIDNVFPQVATNFTLAEIISYAKDFKHYKLGDSMGFPNNRTSHMLNELGSTEVAQTLASNSKDVHLFLFGDSDYEPSSTLTGIDAEIKRRLSSGYYDIPEDKPQQSTTPSSTENTGNTAGNTGNSNTNTKPAPAPAPSYEDLLPDVPDENYYDGE